MCLPAQPNRDEIYAISAVIWRCLPVARGASAVGWPLATLCRGGQGPGNGETQALDAVDLPGADKAKDLLTDFGMIQSDEEEAAEAETAPG